MMAANNINLPEVAAFRGFETQSATDGNHNFSQLLTNLSNIDKSKDSSPNSNLSNGGTN